MPKKSIFGTLLKSKIEKHQSELLKDESEQQYDNYLTKVFEEVNKSFDNHFGKEYVFAKAYYLPSEEKPPLTTVSFCPETKRNIMFSQGILEAEAMVKNKVASSLAEYVVHHDVLGVMICKCDLSIVDGKVPPKFTCYRFGDPTNPFVKIDRDNAELRTAIMVEKHKSMMINSGNTQIISYVLRTRNLDKDFNGTLYIVLTRPMEIEEYREIIDYFTFIMQVRIKYEMSFKISKTEWRKITEYRSHALHHQHLATAGIKRSLIDAFENQDKKKFYDNMKMLDAIENYTKNFDDMAYALQKIEGKKANYDRLQDNDKVKSLLRPQKIEIRAAIIECIEMIGLSLDLIRFEGVEKHKSIVRKKVLNDLMKQVNEKFGPLNLQVVPEMFSVIIQDILKNGVKFTDKNKPKLDVWIDDLNLEEIHLDVKKKLDKATDYFVVAFRNNKGINEKTFDFILNGKITDDLPLEKRVSLGVTTIHRLTHYDGIGLSGQRWFYTPSLTCLEDQNFTTIFLIIPKSDLV